MPIAAGYIGKLNVRIPWGQLSSKPVTIEIEDLFVLASPDAKEDYDADTQAEVAGQDSRSYVENSGGPAASDGDGTPDGDLSSEEALSLIDQIVDNLHLVLRNVHVRYEGQTGAYTSAMGLVLSALRVVPTGSTWREEFISERQRVAHKSLDMEGLAVYWDQGAPRRVPSEAGGRHLAHLSLRAAPRRPCVAVAEQSRGPEGTAHRPG